MDIIIIRFICTKNAKYLTFNGYGYLHEYMCKNEQLWRSCFCIFQCHLVVEVKLLPTTFRDNIQNIDNILSQYVDLSSWYWQYIESISINLLLWSCLVTMCIVKKICRNISRPSPPYLLMHKVTNLKVIWFCFITQNHTKKLNLW